MTPSERALLKQIALDAYKAWDSDLDSRVGKILGALAGKTGYRNDIDSLLAEREESNSREVNALNHENEKLRWALRQCDIMARRQITKSVVCDGDPPDAWQHIRRWCAKAGVNSESGVLQGSAGGTSGDVAERARTLADYRPQHDEDCERVVRFASLPEERKRQPDAGDVCTCGLADLLIVSSESVKKGRRPK